MEDRRITTVSMLWLALIGDVSNQRGRYLKYERIGHAVGDIHKIISINLV